MRLTFGLALATVAAMLAGGCGRQVPLGSGPLTFVDAGDAEAPGVRGPDVAPPTNACVAAGGTCTSARVGCNFPGDPQLRGTCGDPDVMTCCMGLPDGAVHDSDPADLVVGGTGGEPGGIKSDTGADQGPDQT